MIKAIAFEKTVSLTASQLSTAQKKPIDVPFLLRKLTSVQTGRFKARIDLNGYPMSRDRIINTNCFGVATFPFILTAPGYVEEGGEITIDVEDVSAAPNDVRLIFTGITGTLNELKLLTNDFLEKPYFYSKEITIPLADGEDTDVIPGDTDHQFRMIKLMADSVGVFEAEISINNDSVNRGRMHQDTLFGTAQLPFAIDPYDVRRGGIIETDIKDLTSAPNNIIRVCYAGHKVTR